MGPKVVNKNRNCVFNGPYAGRDLYITMYQDAEREFVVTHNADIKPVSYFTGRETELQELRQRIEEGCKSVLVSGMGGIGKTHICRKLFEEYLNKHAGDENVSFKHIGYIEYNGDMNSSLQNCLKFKQQDSPEQNQEAVWSELEYLASGGKLLLFVDNVDKPINADLGLQRLKGIPGAVVLTSRQASFSDEFEPYRIGFLDMEQCKEIYEKIRFRGSEKKVEPEEFQDLEYVIESLIGRHTITVEFLAHLAWTKTWSVKKLREKLEEKGFCLEFHKNGNIVNIQKSYETLYNLSELTGAEQNILEAFAVFPYIPLAAETCNKWLLSDAGVSEDDDILIGLYQKGWLQFDVKQESYVLHPVFAQFIFDKCRPNAENHMKLIEACKKSLEKSISTSATNCQSYIPFVKSQINKLDMENSLEKACLVFSYADYLTYLADYGYAEELYKDYLKICENILGDNNILIAIGYGRLGYVCEWQGKYEKAEELYYKDLLIKVNVLKSVDICMEFSYEGMARINAQWGRYEKAEDMYKNILRKKEVLLDSDDFSIAKLYNDLAGIYLEQGKYEKARELFELSLLINKKVLGEKHLETASNYNNLASVYREQKKYKEAEKRQIEALQIWKRVLEENHPLTAIGYNNLAFLYKAQGDRQKAEILYKNSLKIRENVFGDEHPAIAESYNNLAGVYQEQGEHKKAEELYKKSLRLREKLLGEEHPDTAVSYNNLAFVYDSQGKYQIALTYYLDSYKVLVFRLGMNHSHTHIVYKNMKIAYCEWNPDGNFEQWLEEKMKE